MGKHHGPTSNRIKGLGKHCMLAVKRHTQEEFSAVWLYRGCCPRFKLGTVKKWKTIIPLCRKPYGNALFAGHR